MGGVLSRTLLVAYVHYQKISENDVAALSPQTLKQPGSLHLRLAYLLVSSDEVPLGLGVRTTILQHRASAEVPQKLKQTARVESGAADAGTGAAVHDRRKTDRTGIIDLFRFDFIFLLVAFIKR